MVIKSIVDQVIIPPIERSHKLKRLLYYISEKIDLYGYTNYKNVFIGNGATTRYNQIVRSELLERFEEIDRHVPISSSKTDGLFLAEALLSLDVMEGEIVECGSYAGGSTAKLSILSKITGRRLRVFDSFEGLPCTDEYNLRDYNVRESGKWMSDWYEGKYGAKLEYVKHNVDRFGEVSVCQFYPGWFDVTLTEENLPKRIALAFADVDLGSSARTCLEAIWPKICEKGVYFSHDVSFIKALQSMLDVRLWQEVLREFPPILIGGGYGMGDCSPELGFFVKGTVSAEYINSLTLNK